MDSDLVPQDPTLEDGVYSVCSEEQLHTYTATGARLVRMLLVEKPATTRIPGSYNSSTCRHEPDQITNHGLATVALFVIFTPRASAAKEQAREIERLAYELNGLRRSSEELTESDAKKTESLKTLHAMCDEKERKLSEERTRCYRAEERAGKMERDIAKIRQAVGEIEMKRILGDAP